MDILIGLLVVGTSLALALALPVVSFLRATRAAREVERLSRELARVRAQLDMLQASVPTPASDAHASGGPPALPEEAAAWHQTVQALRGAPTPAPPTPAPVVSVPRDDLLEDSLEQRIGGRWLLYAGMAALLLGISYFVKYAFDNGWVSEPLRVGIGLLAGAALLTAGLLFSRRGLALFGHVIAGGGIVALYLSLYAALHMYALVGAPTAFVAMALVTGASAILAHRERAQAFALMALLGGFATPFLVGSGGRPLLLLTYIALLLAGTTMLALRHAWPALHLVAYALTAITLLSWNIVPDAGVAWLRTELFLTLYLGMFLLALFALRRQAGSSPAARLVVLILATAPVMYHLASVALLASHAGALLVYFVLFTVGGLSASYHTRQPWLRSAVLVLVALPLMAWMDGLRRPGWYTGAVVTACAVYGLHLAAQWRAVSDEDDGAGPPVSVAEIAHTHLTGLFLPAALYWFFEQRAAWWNPPMLTALAAWNGLIAWTIRTRVATLPSQFAALAATLAAVAIGVWFDGPAVAVGWAMEAAALASLAVARDSRWLGGGSAALFAMAALRLVDMLATPLPVTSWPVLNTRTLAVALVIGAAVWVARRLKSSNDASAPLARDVLIVGAHVVAIAWISADLHAVFQQRAYAADALDRPAGILHAELFEQVALSVAWALYAVALVAAGIRRRYAPARYLAIALFGLTIVKVMTRDIAQLDRLYQMLSVLGVGALLLLASYLYQRVARESQAGRTVADGDDQPVH